jgi:hypothetical protein
MKLSLPDYGKHVLFVGSTGSGKSFLAEKMLENYDSYIAIDTQDSLELPGKHIDNLKMIRYKLSHYPKLIYAPRAEFLEREYWDFLFNQLLQSSTKRHLSPRVCYIDEIYHLGYGYSNFSRWLAKSVTTARQRKISYWISSQRPRLIPPEVVTEAAKIYVFYLSKADDMKFIASFARDNPKELFLALQGQQDDYSFIEIDNRKGTWLKYPALGKKF